MKKYKVLLAEDDFDFGSILKQYLEIHNFEVTWQHDGEAALNTFEKASSIEGYFDICVFDVMMPKMDGFTLAEKIIELDPEVPFVFLTARKLKDDRIQGLKLGADDYIVKPFEADILVLRLNNILKRTQKVTRTFERVATDHTNQNKVAIGDYLFNKNSQTLTLGETVQTLTEKEALLIDFLFNNRNQLLRREDILLEVWKNDDFFSGRSMDVFISRLRKYFKDDPNITIASTRGVGLTFKIAT